MTKRPKKPLRFTHLHLENWRNFTSVDVPLQRRAFLVGPNESGKSNFLDVFRFLHDITAAEGGFLAAVGKPWRGGFAKLKSLAARHHSDIRICVQVGAERGPGAWEYELGFAQEAYTSPRITSERIVMQGKVLLQRPNKVDEKDPHRLTQTYLEQSSVNQEFRGLAEFFASVSYVHLVPQAVRNLLYSADAENPFGGGLLRRMAELPEEERQQRLAIIGAVLRSAVPQLKELEFWTDPSDKKPHLRARYEHLQGTWQQEGQLSDGTLRLIGLLWALLDGEGPVLIEEPELSLHPGVIRYLPGLFVRLGKRERRQVIVTTHSPDLLRDEGIGLNEVLLLQPGSEGTRVSAARDVGQIQTLVEAGIGLDEAVVPLTSPPGAQGMALTGT